MSNAIPEKGKVADMNIRSLIPSAVPASEQLTGKKALLGGSTIYTL